MAMLDDLDISKPDGATEPVAVLDNYQRETKTKLKEWATVEHILGTGAHKIPSGDTATRPAFGNAGRIYINTELKTIQRDTGAAWEDLVHYYQRFKVGTYTGDGTSNKAITGVGFQPTYLQVIPLTGTNPSFVKTVNHAVGDSHQLDDGATSTTGIDTLDADGFTIDSSANVNTIIYAYMAMRSVP